MAERKCPFCGEDMVASQTKIRGEINEISFVMEGIVYECPVCHEKVYGPLSAKLPLCIKEGERNENLRQEQNI